MDAVVIVAGGAGKRMGGTPKQFRLLGGKPVLMHSVEAFHRCGSTLSIIIALPEASFPFWQDICEAYNCSIPHETVIGGKERFHSVHNGLQKVEKGGVVGVHDGARPLVTPKLIDRCYAHARKHGSAVPAVPATESLRWLEDNGRHHSLERNRVRIIQTPQCFHTEPLQEAYEKAFSPSFTDEATVFEAAGHAPHLVNGDPDNLKITREGDLEKAERIMNGQG